LKGEIFFSFFFAFFILFSNVLFYFILFYFILFYFIFEGAIPPNINKGAFLHCT